MASKLFPPGRAAKQDQTTVNSSYPTNMFFSSCVPHASEDEQELKHAETESQKKGAGAACAELARNSRWPYMFMILHAIGRRGCWSVNIHALFVITLLRAACFSMWFRALPVLGLLCLQ